MDTKAELKKWKDEFAKADTEEAKRMHKARFNAFIKSLPPSDRQEFAKEFINGANQSVAEAKRLVEIVERKKKLEKILKFVSMAYIAEHYFGKTRNWLYQRINGNIVNGKPADFTPDEIKTLSLALSELGEELKNSSMAIM